MQCLGIIWGECKRETDPSIAESKYSSVREHACATIVSCGHGQVN